MIFRLQNMVHGGDRLTCCLSWMDSTLGESLSSLSKKLNTIGWTSASQDRERIYISYWRLGEIGALIIAEPPGELRNTGSLGLGWSLGICFLF